MINSYMTMHAQVPNHVNDIAKNIELAIEFIGQDNKIESINWLKNIWQSIWLAKNNVSFLEYAYALLTIPKQKIIEFEGNLEELIEEQLLKNRKDGATIGQIKDDLAFFFKDHFCSN